MSLYFRRFVWVEWVCPDTVTNCFFLVYSCKLSGDRVHWDASKFVGSIMFLGFSLFENTTVYAIFCIRITVAIPSRNSK